MSHKTLAWIEPVHDHPETPEPPEEEVIWGPEDPRPTPPIVIPPDAISPGVPTHPIFIPVHPAHPIVIPPGAISPDPPIPAHPIVLPPPRPEHPIVIPPGSISPGVPAHPIVLPIYPANPIALPPSGEGWFEVFILGIGWTWIKFSTPPPSAPQTPEK